MNSYTFNANLYTPHDQSNMNALLEYDQHIAMDFISVAPLIMIW